MRMGFRDPFADEPSLLLSFLPTPLLLWQRSGVGARQVRSYGRRKELTYNKIQGGRYFKAEGVLNEAAQFSIWQLRRHFICNWNWCSAASANMSEDEANSPRSEVNSWQLTVPHTGSNIRDGGGGWRWCWWTMEKEVSSAEGPGWETPSHVALCALTWPRGYWGYSHSQHGASPPEKARGGRMLFVQRVMSVNQSMELSVEVGFLCSLREPAFNGDRTWQVEFPLAVPRLKNMATCTTRPCKQAFSCYVSIDTVCRSDPKGTVRVATSSKSHISDDRDASSVVCLHLFFASFLQADSQFTHSTETTETQHVQLWSKVG